MKALHILAVVLIILGFGVIHNSHKALEIAGSVSIGIGCLYFIILLLIASKKDKSQQE